MKDLIGVVGNEIYLYNDITEEVARELVITLRKLEKKIKTHIVLYIHSSGGDVYSGLSIMDHIDSLKIPVHTVADGLCCSAATLILLSGKKKLMKKNSRILIHQISTEISTSTHSELLDEVEHMNNLTSQLKNIYTERTKIPSDKLELFMSRDIYLNLEESIQYGIVDCQW